MRRGWRVPLNDGQIATLASMPKSRSGHVVDPRYLPKEEQSEYRDQLLAWARNVPSREWPPFVADLVEQHRLSSGTATGVGDRDLGGAV